MAKLTAFTLESNGGLMQAIITPVRFSLPFDIKPESAPVIHEALALWDTGAMGTVISRSLAVELNLPSIGKTACRGVNSIEDRDTYLIDMYIGQIRVPNVKVFDGNLHQADGAGVQNHRFLIGMNIIAFGDFAYSVRKVNNQLRSVFSFRFPSKHEPIDFVPDTNRHNRAEVMAPANLAARKTYDQTHHKQSRKQRKKK